jgi:tetrahydromethanopterin S-methyltransferase subunit G
MASAVKTTDLERTNLEAHVDLCAQRYQLLEYRLNTIEIKVENISKEISESNKSMAKVIIGTGGTVVAAIVSAIVTMLMKF